MEFQCKDPCRYNNPCGSGADCKATGHKAICSCPRGFTGDPFVNCRKFERADLCSPNPCGPGAECTPGFDNNGNDKPVCTCPRGYRGDPLTSCNRGETRTKKKKTKLKFTSVDFFQANAIAIPTVPLTVAATTSAARILATGGREARAAASLPSAGSLDMVSNWQRFKGCNFYLRTFLSQRNPVKWEQKTGVQVHLLRKCMHFLSAAVCACPSGTVGDPVVACRPARDGFRTKSVGNRFF